MAEHVLRRRLADVGISADEVVVDSSGTGDWHVGEPADERAVAALTGSGYSSVHRARQFEPEWFGRYDLIVVLDHGHLRALRRFGPAAKVRLLREYERDPRGLDVPDPYYGGDFTSVLRIIESAMPNLVAAIRAAAAP
jgi:protein-tyrosine phosphatase